jgi:hypothetical protein
LRPGFYCSTPIDGGSEGGPGTGGSGAGFGGSGGPGSGIGFGGWVGAVEPISGGGGTSGMGGTVGSGRGGSSGGGTGPCSTVGQLWKMLNIESPPLIGQGVACPGRLACFILVDG